MSETDNLANKSWGGARQGAGRPKKYVKNVFFSATQEVAGILESMGRKKSDFINECILKAIKG